MRLCMWEGESMRKTSIVLNCGTYWDEEVERCAVSF